MSLGLLGLVQPAGAQPGDPDAQRYFVRFRIDGEKVERRMEGAGFVLPGNPTAADHGLVYIRSNTVPLKDHPLGPPAKVPDESRAAHLVEIQLPTPILGPKDFVVAPLSCQAPAEEMARWSDRMAIGDYQLGLAGRWMPLGGEQDYRQFRFDRRYRPKIGETPHLKNEGKVTVWAYTSGAKQCDGMKPGYVRITRLDTERQEIAGEFQFDAMTSLGLPPEEANGLKNPPVRILSAHITEGEFLLPYCAGTPEDHRRCPRPTQP